MNCARRVLLAAIIMISVFFLPASTAAAPENDEESIEERLKEQLQTYDMSQWDAVLSSETSGVLPTEYSSVSDMVEGIALGDMPLDAQGVFDTHSARRHAARRARCVLYCQIWIKSGNGSMYRQRPH